MKLCVGCSNDGWWVVEHGAWVVSNPRTVGDSEWVADNGDNIECCLIL